MAYEDYLNDNDPIDITKGFWLVIGLLVAIALGVLYYVFHQESVNEFVTELCKNLFQP